LTTTAAGTTSRARRTRRHGEPSDRHDRILLSDYAGHGFTTELAIALREQRGLDVTYAYCSTVTSPKGRVDQGDRSIGVPSGSSFEKYRPWRRLISEIRYGLSTVRVMRRVRPTTHVVCNMPLVSLLVMWLGGLLGRTRLVIWFQDAQSGIAEGVLGRGIRSRAIDALEGLLLRRASRVVAISEELAHEARLHRVDRRSITVLENWAPIEQLPVVARDNAWSREHGTAQSPLVFTYSGTLGRKHRADMLVELAHVLEPQGGRVVVVSEGEGASSLRERKARGDLANLTVFGYQPFSRLPEVLGSADVLVVLLEPTAGQFSVPSKTLSYLCAGRPVLAAMSATNTAATILQQRALAGLVVEPDDPHAFGVAALRLAKDPALREELGRSGRAYAEAHFSSDLVLDRFVAAIGA
jgi:colanic acid biosynthesis glycosyl transferase WcaI